MASDHAFRPDFANLNKSLIPREGAPTEKRQSQRFELTWGQIQYRDDKGQPTQLGDLEPFVGINGYFYPLSDIINSPRKYRPQDLRFKSMP